MWKNKIFWNITQYNLLQWNLTTFHSTFKKTQYRILDLKYVDIILKDLLYYCNINTQHINIVCKSITCHQPRQYQTIHWTILGHHRLPITPPSFGLFFRFFAAFSPKCREKRPQEKGKMKLAASWLVEKKTIYGHLSRIVSLFLLVLTLPPTACNTHRIHVWYNYLH